MRALYLAAVFLGALTFSAQFAGVAQSLGAAMMAQLAIGLLPPVAAVALSWRASRRWV